MADWTKVLNEADIATARLIVELQKQDAVALTQASVEQQGETDADFARRIFENELQEIHGLFPARALDERVRVGVNQDAVFGRPDFKWRPDDANGSGKRSVPQVPSPPPMELVTCTACGDEVYEDSVVKAPCSHVYCRSCLENLFARSMKDETLCPPKCCKQPIPVAEAQKILPRGLVWDFVNQQEEAGTKDKTYCARPGCSAFIRPNTIHGNHAKCPRCKQATCAECKNKWHTGDCPQDKALEQLLTTADQNHWRKCSRCKRVVELNTGCNHITCRCGFEFCYLCGEKWKKCGCPMWEEAHLLAPGQVIAPAEEPPDPRPQPEGRRARRRRRRAEAQLAAQRAQPVQPPQPEQARPPAQVAEPQAAVHLAAADQAQNEAPATEEAKNKPKPKNWDAPGSQDEEWPELAY